MPQFQRFDDETAPPITPQEIKHRWIEFHRQIRLMSGTRLQRTAGRMLGEDTRRYHLARFLFRPLLQLLRSMRRTKTKKVVRALATSATVIFPVNYRPVSIDYVAELATYDYDPNDVYVVEVDDAERPTSALLSGLNDELNVTTSEWIFVVSAASTEVERRFSAAALLAHARPGDDVIFADEAGPNDFAPILKSPGVGPHTLLSYDVIGRPALLRVETVFALGGFDPDAGFAFEHDLYLRLRESTAAFRHVPRVLPAGRAPGTFVDERRDDDTVMVVAAALERRAMKGRAERGELHGLVHWSLDAPVPPPRVDIIIPTRDRIDLLRRCIASIEETTTYANYDVIILDNDSVKPETLEYFEATPYRVVPCPGPFNYAHIVNRGVAHSSADYVVTLNNDTTVVTEDWLEQLVALASLPDVGIVGARLLDPDHRMEHEGIIVAPYPQHLRTDTNYPHLDCYSAATRDVAAVTGAVQMVERTFWASLGGMDEQLRVVMNDVDICFRAQMEDKYVLYTPHVALYHHVGSSRGDLDPLDDRNRFIRRWDIFGTFRDPYFPESLLLLGEKVFYFVR